ncbi:ABC transporter ATP-binding protein [Trichococcus pasteurii]|uniref:Abc transporter n=1 Tax=Trichococcus pasteurii TaxID=43064 RepID=A0A1W1IDR0_9LACT|nr:ABC transporter ATP-binding protein [Trichococcus pasteurii]SFE06183.1 putative ABC transport system ATP-binding protein [Trichococcus pasteurii]SLM51167.1 abc transporter [Trichococcus pasteurii]SSB92048.1 abc transporter [Trichococcus pasteurii]
MITMTNVTKTYKTGDVETYALKDVNLTIEEGEFVVILGPSGSGKSTLLNVISGLDTVTSGEIIFRGETLTNLDEDEMTAFRRKHLGFIFQQYNLLQNLNVYENIQIGSDIGTAPLDIADLLEKVGLEKARDKYPSQLSGGEQQRVSIVRSLAKNPDIIFCDEPTGSLDEENSKKILQLLQNLNEDYNKTVIVITHNLGIAEMADKVIKMNSGQIKEVTLNKVKKNAQDISWG